MYQCINVGLGLELVIAGVNYPSLTPSLMQ
jgi:hypothetical protein